MTNSSNVEDFINVEKVFSTLFLSQPQGFMSICRNVEGFLISNPFRCVFYPYIPTYSTHIYTLTNYKKPLRKKCRKNFQHLLYRFLHFGSHN
jgi:hypothetical protein